MTPRRGRVQRQDVLLALHPTKWKRRRELWADICEQNEWERPDRVIVPRRINIILHELEDAGLAASRMAELSAEELARRGGFGDSEWTITEEGLKRRTEADRRAVPDGLMDTA